MTQPLWILVIAASLIFVGLALLVRRFSKKPKGEFGSVRDVILPTEDGGVTSDKDEEKDEQELKEELQKELKRREQIYAVSKEEAAYIKFFENVLQKKYMRRYRTGLSIFFGAMGLSLIVFLLLIVLTVVEILKESMSLPHVIVFLVGAFTMLFLFIAQLWYFIKSIRTVKANEFAFMTFLDAPIREAKPGPHIVPYSLGDFLKETTELVQVQYPAQSKKISYKNKGEEEDGKVQLDRVTLGLGHKNPEKDPWKARRTVGISYSISLGVDPSNLLAFFRFTSSLAKAQEWADDIAHGLYGKILCTEDLDTIYENFLTINETLRRFMEILLKPRGVRVFRVELVIVDFGLSFNTLIQAEANALLEKAAKVVDAEAEKQVSILSGEAEGKVRKILAAADAFGYWVIARNLKIEEKEVVLLVEAMKNTLKESNNTVVLGVDGITDIFTGAKRLLEGMGVGGVK